MLTFLAPVPSTKGGDQNLKKTTKPKDLKPWKELGGLFNVSEKFMLV